jgi:2-polyprenyl-6-methoxyphenol hydroxylase-like FAD-dependent oxidoreductase
MAGLGLNLGIGDATRLATVLNEAHELGQDMGDINILKPYNQEQLTKNALTMGAIDGLWRLFHTDFFPARWARSVGMQWIQQVKPFKSFLMSQAMK